MNQQEQTGLLVQLLQEKMKRQQRVIERLRSAGNDLHIEMQYMVPASPQNFNDAVHSTLMARWTEANQDAGYALSGF